MKQKENMPMKAQVNMRSISSSRAKRVLLVLATILVGVLCTVLPASVTQTGAAAGAAASAGTKSCQWVLSAEAGDLNNWGWADENARYALGVIPIPAGGYTEIKGRFPHSRYLAMQTYDLTIKGIDSLYDVLIKPDRGSINPFKVGANRQAKNRSYTIRVINARVPQGNRPTNRLYTESRDGKHSTKGLHLAVILLRNYLPDAGRDVSGGVGWPRVTSVAANGSRKSLDCPVISLPGIGAPILTGLGGLTPNLPVGYDPPKWIRQNNNVLALLLQGLDGTATSGLSLDAIAARMPALGIGENLNAKYMGATVSSTHGKAVIFTGKAPTVPHTFAGQPIMRKGQLRYWSFCSYELETTQFLGCVNDERIPIDARGYYHVVVSPANKRPKNARTACGYAWLPMAPLKTLMAVRNILPSPTFTHAVQNVTQPGKNEPSTLREYYPRGKYYPNAAAVEKLGCHAR